MSASEDQFAALLERGGKLYFEQPKKFKLPPPYHSYRPDFYVVDDGIFYEVVGTRQAYSYNRKKYKLFASEYPDLRLEIVKPDGSLYKPHGPRVSSVKPAAGPRKYISTPLSKLLKREGATANQKELLQAIVASGHNIATFARVNGVRYPALVRYLQGGYKYDPIEVVHLLGSSSLALGHEKMTLRDKADITGLSVSTIFNYYNNRHKLKSKTIEKISNTLREA
jgi:hypothetical protein